MYKRVEQYFKSLKKLKIYELYLIMKYLFAESSDLDEYFLEDVKLFYKTFNLTFNYRPSISFYQNKIPIFKTFS
jgi:hypothetical protein